MKSVMAAASKPLLVSREAAGPWLGASLLVMSIVGGAIIPAAMGWISDLSSIQTAFILPLVCYAYVLYFAMRGHRPRPIGVSA